jgi:hypothetical protein
MQTTIVVVPEWLSGMTRNHVGFARAGSSPADHVFCFIFLFLLCVTVCLSPWTKTHWTCVARPAKITLSLGLAEQGTLTDPGPLQLVGKFMGYSGLYCIKIVFTELHCMDAVAVDLNSSDD